MNRGHKNEKQVRTIRGMPPDHGGANGSEKDQKPALTRVAAYCRVSTDQRDQESSFEAQKSHFESLINSHDDWTLAQIYADEESGTRTWKRDHFLRMIEDCERGEIDMVLTKSISRFARNTVDCLQFIRKLRAMGIPVIFDKEGINTMDAGGEVLLTILASIAQQESASISRNVQMGVRYHYQEGRVCAGVHRLLGYRRTADGSLEIIPEEAWIVQRIYRDYLDGYSPGNIAKILAEEGIDGTKTTAGGVVMKRSWNASGIEYILRNEKYSGDLLLQKYYTVDFLNKKVARNTGQLPQYFVENNHAPIIPKDIFMLVQSEMAQRKKNWRAYRYEIHSPLSGHVICGNCGRPFRKARQTWYCESRLNKKRHPGVFCEMDSVRDSDLRECVRAALNRLPEAREWLETQESASIVELRNLEKRLSGLEADMASLEETAASELRDLWSAASDRRAEVLSRLLYNRSLKARTDRLTDTPEPERPSLAQKSADVPEPRNHRADTVSDVQEISSRTAPGKSNIAPFEQLSGACTNSQDFFRRTAPSVPAGPVTALAEDDIIRYVSKVEVHRDHLTVCFRAGLRMDVLMG